MSPLRIGAVSYLNSKPLVEGLAERVPGARLTLDYPSRLAADLAAGELDVALIPSIEYFRGQATGEYVVLSDACVAARGPVQSVKLYSRVPIPQIRTLALDEGSRTSATLARVLLAERYGVFPEREPLPLGHQVHQTAADAILLIGDRAMYPMTEPFAAEWDLGEEWLAWTGLPFVFAMWVARQDAEARGVDLAAVAEALSGARDDGVARAAEIARREAPRLGLPFEQTVTYLTRHLHFTLGTRERQGLRRYYQYASQLQLAPTGVDLVFRDCTPA